MNVYSSQPLAEFIDQLRQVAERERFGHAFVAKLDELRDELAWLREELEESEIDSE